MKGFTAIMLLCGWSCVALTLQAEANPIRKVVTILQDMQKELEAEGVKEKASFDKFLCYCDGNTDGMSKDADEASQRITELKSKLEAEKAEKSQLDQELIQHKQDREGARKDLDTATAIREKEHSDFVESSGEQKADLDAMTGALAALSKGMGQSFMQANTAGVARLTRVVQASNVDEFDRTEVLDLLQGKNPNGDYSARSGEIVGILKAMKDEMDKDLNGAVSEEESAQSAFEGMSDAKKSEIGAASEAIEAKTVRSGELAVSVTTCSDDIEDTTRELSDTQAFLANLASQCATKKQEWAERTKMRAEEVAAISEAVKIMNDDDALDLFKKTLSLAQQPSMSFLAKKSSMSVVLKARNLIKAASKSGSHQAELALIASALKAKAVDFSKVLGMIDGMVTVLTNEQKDDDSQSAFCKKDLENSEGEKADTEAAIETSETAISEMSAASATTGEEIANLNKEIKALDKAVAEATEQRKEEHGEFLTFQTENNAAVQLIEKAKNRLFKFYRPTMHKEAPKRELTQEERLVVASGGEDPRVAEAALAAQAVFVQLKDDGAPPPPPETWGAYEKKSGKSNGVIALMEMLAKELQDGIVESEHDEETAQKDYERLMSDSQASRAQMVESITSKEASKADLDTKVESTKQAKTAQEAELSNIKNYIAQLHANCDFLIDNYDLRKQARANEQDSLKNAKSVLSGANFS